jgi:hypothetical protein
MTDAENGYRTRYAIHATEKLFSDRHAQENDQAGIACIRARSHVPPNVEVTAAKPQTES